MFDNLRKYNRGSYEDGYEETFEDGDFDDYRYEHDFDYSEGVEDALDDGGGDW